MNVPAEDLLFSFSKLNKQRSDESEAWLQFIEKDSLRCGIYHLKAGSEDKQQPHLEDEVYYVVSGKSHFECEGRVVPVEPGSILYVAAKQEHRFTDIEEDLSILVFFARNK